MVYGVNVIQCKTDRQYVKYMQLYTYIDTHIPQKQTHMPIFPYLSWVLTYVSPTSSHLVLFRCAGWVFFPTQTHTIARTPAQSVPVSAHSGSPDSGSSAVAGWCAFQNGRTATCNAGNHQLLSIHCLRDFINHCCFKSMEFYGFLFCFVFYFFVPSTMSF